METDMPYKLPAFSIRSLQSTLRGLAWLLPLALISCNDSATTSLTDVEAAPVMAQRLAAVQNDIVVVVGFPTEETITCDNLGTYTISGIDRTVCQIYNVSGSESVPEFSPNGVDLVSRVPAGDSSAVLAAVDADLQNAVWAPVLKSTAIAFGRFEAGITITGEFTVQGGDASLISGSCDIVDSTGNVDAAATLVNTGVNGRDATLQFNAAAGFGLVADQYQLDCTFSESGVDNSVTGAGSFEVFLSPYARFDPANGVIPFPNNLLFKDSFDGTLNIPVANATDYSDPKVAMNALDGFSTVAPLSAKFSSGIDSSTLIGGETVRLFEVTLSGIGGAVTAITTELVPGTDYVVALSTFDTSNTTISILPLKPLQPNSSYLVTLSRGISSILGDSAKPDASYASAKGTSALVTDPACLVTPGSCLSAYTDLTDEQAEALEPIRQLTNVAELAVASYTISNDATDVVTDLATSDIVLSWSFTTQSIGSVLSYVGSGTGAQAVITADSGMTTAHLGLAGAAAIHLGTLDVTYYLTAAADSADTAPLNNFWLGVGVGGSFLTQYNPAPANPTIQTIPLLLTLPFTGIPPAGGWPVVIFQHGINENRSNLLAVADVLANAGFAAVAIDLPLHGITDSASPFYAGNNPLPDRERTFDLDLIDNTTKAAASDNLIDESGAHFLNFTNLLVGRDNLRQGIIDLMTLKASLVNIASIDSSKVYFVGHSLGAMAGIPFLSLEPAVQEAVLAMPGGGIPRLLDGSVSFGPEMSAAIAATGVVKGSADYDSFLTAAQTALDSADPINYTSSVGNSRGLLLFEVVGGNSSLPDQIIPNNLWPTAATASSPSPLAGTDPLAESIALVKVDPANSATTSGFDLQAWVRFNAGHHGSLLTTNDADGNADVLSAQVTVEMQSQMAGFLASQGSSVIIGDDTLIETTP